MIFNYTSWRISVKSTGVVCPMNFIKVTIVCHFVAEKVFDKCEIAHLSFKLIGNSRNIIFSSFTISVVFFDRSVILKPKRNWVQIKEERF